MMLKIQNNYILSISLLLALISSGCAPVYVPSASHTHLLDEKGELNAAAYTGTNGVDAQAAYALMDEFGLVGGVSFHENSESSADDHQHAYFELGADYFNKLGSIGRLEIIGGLGLGSAETKDQYEFFGPNEVTAKGSYSKLFLQSNIGMETNAFDAGLSLKLSQVVFSKFETSRQTYNETRSAAFFEPSVFLKAGWNNIKLVSQFGISSPLEEEIAFDYVPVTFSLGIQGNFNIQNKN